MVTEPTGSRRRPGKPVVLVSIAVAILAVAVLLALRWIGTTNGAEENPAKQPVAQTTKIVKTTLSGGRLLDGSLGYGQPRPVKGTGQGRITWLPAAGTTVKRGDQLYRVDDSPVSLFYGALPLFRTLSEKDTVGRDVRVVADNLAALGYRIGSQPKPGKVITRAAPMSAAAAAEPASQPGASGAARPAAPTPQPTEVTVRDGDAVLTSTLITAIKEWQRDKGMPATGVLGPADITVHGGEVRVDTVVAQTGDPAETAVMNVTPTAKVITVQVEAAEASGIAQGGPVSVTLPDGRPVAGKVTAVGTALIAPEGVNDSPNPNAKPKLAVTITLDDIAVVANLDTATLKVEFPSETRENVLAVPVGALVALSEGGYGVQLAGGQLVAVETGLFAKGLVEVTGAGIAEGTTVVTTS